MHKHGTGEAAQREAERLAQVNPGEEFIVLEAVSSSKSVNVVTTPLHYADPFQDD